MKTMEIFANIIVEKGSSFAPGRKWTKAEAEQWFIESEWSHGLKAKLHPSINVLELASQYHKNKLAWDNAFLFLRNTNFDSIAPGKYTIDGDNIFAMISDGPTKDIADSKWEFHEKYIDVQYVIRGEETMGIAGLSNATIVDPYNESKDITFCNIPEADCKYYIATPDEIFIFFPQDAHRPALKTDKCDSSKKVVVKIKVE
jgi:biofilm protein TabA